METNNVYIYVYKEGWVFSDKFYLNIKTGLYLEHDIDIESSLENLKTSPVYIKKEDFDRIKKFIISWWDNFIKNIPKIKTKLSSSDINRDKKFYLLMKKGVDPFNNLPADIRSIEIDRSKIIKEFGFLTNTIKEKCATKENIINNRIIIEIGKKQLYKLMKQKNKLLNLLSNYLNCIEHYEQVPC